MVKSLILNGNRNTLIIGTAFKRNFYDRQTDLRAKFGGSKTSR